MLIITAMLIIVVAVFLCCLALCLHLAYRLHQAPSKRLRAWLAGSVVAVLVLGAAGAIIFAQERLIGRQGQFLNAAFIAFAATRSQVATYNANGNAVSIPCSKGITAADNFYTDFATAPTWQQAPVSDHSIVAVLSYSMYEMLQAKGCITPTQLDTTLTHLRAMQSADAHSASMADRFLMTVPIGLMPMATSMRAVSAITWANLSPHAITVQNCFDAITRAQQNTPTQSQIAACRAPIPRVTHV